MKTETLKKQLTRDFGANTLRFSLRLSIPGLHMK